MWNKLMHALNGNSTARSALHEFTQARKISSPRYSYESSGLAHDPTHQVTVKIYESNASDSPLMAAGIGIGKNKTAAEEAAAQSAMPMLVAAMAELELRRKAAENVQTVMIGAREITEALGREYYWKYVIVDAENIAVPKLSYPFPKLTKYLLAGSDAHLKGWANARVLPACSAMVTQPGRDAADNAIVARLPFFDPRETIVLTNDKLLTQRILATGPYVVGSSIECTCYNVDAMAAVLPDSLHQTLVKYSMVPEIHKHVRHRPLVDPTTLWIASL
jgi:hypothetical protein